jgi:hypothetical protein
MEKGDILASVGKKWPAILAQRGVEILANPYRPEGF